MRDDVPDVDYQYNFGRKTAYGESLGNVIQAQNLTGLADKVPEHEAGKVCVKPLVPRNQLVVKVEDGHQALLLQDLVAFLELIHWRAPRGSVYGVEELVSVLPVLDVAG